MNRSFFTSDFHFCHDQKFIYVPRGFNSITEMNREIVKRFNEVMDWEDELYILGDCFLNDNDQGMRLMRQIPGHKHIIWGNHDSDTRKSMMEAAGFDCLGYATIRKINGFQFYMSHYPSMTTNFDDEKPLKNRVLSLSGHTHSKDIWDAAGGYNVALDAHECYPVPIEEIIDAFKKRKVSKNS